MASPIHIVSAWLSWGKGGDASKPSFSANTTSNRGGANGGEGFVQDITYEIASHVLTVHKKQPVSHASQGLDANADKGERGKPAGAVSPHKGIGQIVERLGAPRDGGRSQLRVRMFIRC